MDFPKKIGIFVHFMHHTMSLFMVFLCCQVQFLLFNSFFIQHRLIPDAFLLPSFLIGLEWCLSSFVASLILHNHLGSV